MSASEPRSWTQRRREQAPTTYPVLADNDPADVLRVDNWGFDNQQKPPTDFTRVATALGAYGGEQVDDTPNVDPWDAQADTGSVGPMGPASPPKSPARNGGYTPDTLSGFLGRVLEAGSRPAGAVAGALSADTPAGSVRGLGEGWQNPDISQFRDVGGVRLLPDNDVASWRDLAHVADPLGIARPLSSLLPSERNLSPRDIGGGIAAAGLDPLNLVPGIGNLDDLVRGSRAANRGLEAAAPRAASWLAAADQALTPAVMPKPRLGQGGAVDDLINPDRAYGTEPFATRYGATRADDLGQVAEVDAYLRPRIGDERLQTLRDFEKRQLAGDIYDAERSGRGGQTPAMAGGADELPPVTQAEVEAISARLKASGMTPQQIVNDPEFQAASGRLFRNDYNYEPTKPTTAHDITVNLREARNQDARIASSGLPPDSAMNRAIHKMWAGSEEGAAELRTAAEKVVGGAEPTDNIHRAAASLIDQVNGSPRGTYYRGMRDVPLDSFKVGSTVDVPLAAAADNQVTALRYTEQGSNPVMLVINGRGARQTASAELKEVFVSGKYRVEGVTPASGSRPPVVRLRQVEQFDVPHFNEADFALPPESPRLGGGAETPSQESLMRGAPTETVQPPLAAERTYLKRLFNVDAPEPVLDAGDRFAGAARALFGGVREDEIATPIVKMIESSKPRIQSQAARMGSVIEAEANGAFTRDAVGRIADLPGTPTIQTIAARFPEYEGILTPQQRTAMERIRSEVADYRPLVDEAGIEIGNRRDIMDGGFYLPRGKVVSVKGRNIGGGSGRGGGSSGYRKEAVFDSMEQGIDAGYRYEPLASAVSRHVEQTGGDAVRKYAETLFKEARGAEGDLLGTSQADRMDPGLRTAVVGLRNKIAGRLQTLRNQTARAGVQGQAARDVARDASRLERLSVSAETRALLKSAKIEQFDVSTPSAILESFPSVETLRSEADGLRAQLAQRTGARGLADRLGEKEALIALRQAADQSGGDLDKMLDIINEYGEQSARFGEAAAPRPSIRGTSAPASGTPERVQYDLTHNRGQRGAVRSVGADAPFDGPLSAYETYDNILAHTLDSASVDTSRVPSSEAAIRAARRELSVLSRESRKAQARAGTAAGRVEKAAGARAVTQYELDVLRGELDELTPRYQSALTRAAQTPLFEGQIDLPGLRGTSFPSEVANAANRRLDNMKPATGKLTVAVKAAEAVNALLRMTGSTLDISGTALQGLLGAANDPRAYGSALKTSVNGWWNPDSLGAYFADFDKRAAQAGKPTSKDWASVGQRIGSNLTEYTGEGLPEAIRKAYEGAIPGTERIVKGGLNPARGANRQFGFFGDVLRNELSDTAYDIASGARNQFGISGTAGAVSRDVMADIAKSSNRMTGWTTRRFGGDIGELSVFAPRYFQANIETLLSGVQGMRPGASMSQQQSRNALLRLIGIGTALTVAANEARGKETDFRLTVNGRDNPNFVRLMDVGGQDVSLFGTMDRLVHLVAKSATGQKAQAARSFLNSPIIGRAWDLIEGKDAIGNGVRDNPQQFAGYLLRSVAPFSGQSYAQGAQQAAQGEYGRAAATVGVGASGLRGSPQSIAEQVAAGRFDDLNTGDQFKAVGPKAWNKVATEVPAFKDTAGGFNSYFEWHAAKVKEVTDTLVKAGTDPAEAMKRAETVVQGFPAAKAYAALKDHYEDEWVVQNKDEAIQKYHEEMAKPWQDRRWTPTKKQRELMGVK